MSEVISPLSNYYDGKTVFLTGGSGFLGHLYIQKLLRSKISHLYLFIRPKRGESIPQRLEKLFDNPVSYTKQQSKILRNHKRCAFSLNRNF